MHLLFLLVLTVNIIISWKGFKDGDFFDRYAFDLNAVKRGQHWRMWTSGWLHVDSQHLIFNMFTLYFFAPIVIQTLGSIAFLATVHYGFPSYLDRYVKHLYHNFSRTYYNEPMGYNIKKTVDQLYDEFPGSEGTRYTVQSYAFAGDPAVAVASFDRPEYMVLDGGVFFNPPIITGSSML